MRLGLGLGLCDRWRFGGGGSPPPPAPSITTVPSPITVSENAAIGSIVATLSVANGTGTYSWLLTDGGEPSSSALSLHDIGGNQAELRVQNLDFETHPTLHVTGFADNGGGAVIFNLTVTVTDAVEAGGFAPVLLALGVI